MIIYIKLGLSDQLIQYYGLFTPKKEKYNLTQIKSSYELTQTQRKF